MTLDLRKLLLIHAIPEGMVAVLRHTVHGLLLAELSGRIPVIYWGSRFLYRRVGKDENAFLRFFEDVGCCDGNRVTSAHGGFLPTDWSAENVFNDRLISYLDDESRSGVAQPPLEMLLNSEAAVVVYTHWNHLVDILPFVPEGSEYHGLDNATVAGMIFRKYFKVLPEVLAPAKVILEAVTAPGRVIGVHCRGSDKITEHALVTPEDYRKEVNRILRKDDRVFLATDSLAALKKFQGWYGDRLIFTDCERSSNAQGVHFTAMDREKAGCDFLVDAYLLSKCAVHFGNEGSHVSYLVQAMLREGRRPFDNFVNVRASSLSRLKRDVCHRLPAWGRRKLGNSLRRIGLRGRKEKP
jgi:hypothetical protein